MIQKSENVFTRYKFQPKPWFHMSLIQIQTQTGLLPVYNYTQNALFSVKYIIWIIILYSHMLECIIYDMYVIILVIKKWKLENMSEPLQSCISDLTIFPRRKKSNRCVGTVFVIA